MFAAGIVLAYVNAFLIGAGANIWGAYMVFLGFAAAFISVPLFWWRHYVVDRGKFPRQILSDPIPTGETELGPTRAGGLPYLARAGGAALVAAG